MVRVTICDIYQKIGHNLDNWILKEVHCFLESTKKSEEPNWMFCYEDIKYCRNRIDQLSLMIDEGLENIDTDMVTLLRQEFLNALSLETKPAVNRIGANEFITRFPEMFNDRRVFQERKTPEPWNTFPLVVNPYKTCSHYFENSQLIYIINLHFKSVYSFLYDRKAGHKWVKNG